MSKKAGIVFVIIGAVLILSALLLFLWNRQEDEHAGEESAAVLQEVYTALEDVPLSPAPSGDAENLILPEEMHEVEIDGYAYIGYLEIPDLGIELPVMAECDYTRMKIAPCRQFGSSRTDDLVIAAHNYKRHFGRLSELTPGAEIDFTDMDGIVNRYQLVRLEKLDPKNVDAVQNSGCDLVLYTCTPGGKMRVGAFCQRID